MERAPSDALLRQIASWGLAEEKELLDPPPEDAEWQRLVQRVATHRLSGLLDAAMRAGAIRLDSRRREEVEQLHRQVSTKVLLLDTTLSRVANALTDHLVPMRVLKGPATSALYSDPLLRPYVDIDLLVPGDRFADAAELLTKMGHHRRSVELRPGFDRRFGKGATFHRAADANIDLHRTLLSGPYAFLIEPSTLFDRPAEIEVAGTHLEALCPEAQFVHACISATLSDAEPKLITLRDAVQTFRNPALDLDELRRLCTDWRIGGVVDATMASVNSILGLRQSESLPPDLGLRRSSVVERVAQWGYGAHNKRWRRQALTAIPFVPGWSDRAAYARAVFRSRSFGTT